MSWVSHLITIKTALTLVGVDLSTVPSDEAACPSIDWNASSLTFSTVSKQWVNVFQRSGPCCVLPSKIIRNDIESAYCDLPHKKPESIPSCHPEGNPATSCHCPWTARGWRLHAAAWVHLIERPCSRTEPLPGPGGSTGLPVWVGTLCWIKLTDGVRTY